MITNHILRKTESAIREAVWNFQEPVHVIVVLSQTCSIGSNLNFKQAKHLNLVRKSGNNDHEGYNIVKCLYAFGVPIWMKTRSFLKRNSSPRHNWASTVQQYKLWHISRLLAKRLSKPVRQNRNSLENNTRPQSPTIQVKSVLVQNSTLQLSVYGKA